MIPLQPGAPLGATYRVLERIGSGAAGDVWSVESITSGERLAAKTLKPEHAADPALVERFIRERSVLLGLHHRSIVEVRDLVVEGAILAIVMEYLAGGSARDLLSTQGPLPAADALRICEQVLHALACAHHHHITHRDIKPDNVLLTAPWTRGHGSHVRVSDFGIAAVITQHHRQTTGILGTAQYMAPELISHGRTTSAVDVYSTGAMLYELLAGRTPFAGPGTDFTIAYRHVTARPARLDLPGDLWAAVDLLLAKDPRDRPPASEAADTLAWLADRYPDLPALDGQAVAGPFEAVERPATILRTDRQHEGVELEDAIAGDPGAGTSLGPETPTLSEPGQVTMLQAPSRAPMPDPRPRPVDASRRGEADRPGPWPPTRRAAIALCALATVLLGGLGVGIATLFGGERGVAREITSEAVTAAAQDPPLPTGLAIARSAHFDPVAGEISLQLTLSAQRAPLSGDVLQVVPGVGTPGDCPAVVWSGATARRHSVSTTGLRAACGWKLDHLRIPANGQAVVTARFSGTVADRLELERWLDAAAAATTATLTDPEATSTEYPVQRLQGVEVSVPARTVSETPIPVTLLPIWPSGVDRLNPLFRSPSIGPPTRMLSDVAGDSAPVRFSDGCAGAVSVATDGIAVTALSVTPDCRVRASVGNFTDLESNPFSITTRE